MSTTTLGAPKARRRRSFRVIISIPVIISGQDASGQGFREETQTLDIGRIGAMIGASRRPAWQSEIVIENPGRRRSAKGRVVWCGERASPGAPFAIGVEFGEPQGVRGLWGVEFPPDDWKEPPPSRDRDARPGGG